MLILYSIAYIFDEILSFIIGNNVGGIIFIICFNLIHVLLKNKNLIVKSIKLLFYLLILILTLASYALISDCFLTKKIILSFTLLLIIIILWERMDLSEKYSDKFVINLISSSIIALLIMDKVGVGPEKFFFINNRESGAYFEPSHLAIYILPVFGIGLYLYNNKLTYLLAISCFLFAPSTTIFLGCFFITSLYFFKKLIHLNKIITKAVVIVFLGTLIFYKLFDFVNIQDRLEGIILGALDFKDIDKQLNLSSLVWLNGWSKAWVSILESRGLGLGFNNMGCGKSSESGYYSDTIMQATGGINLNSEDGSILISKIITEFGLFGILLVLTLISKSIFTIMIFLKNAEFDRSNSIRVVGAANLLVLLFIRAPGGYFLIPVLMAIAMLFYKKKNEYYYH